MKKARVSVVIHFVFVLLLIVRDTEMCCAVLCEYLVSDSIKADKKHTQNTQLSIWVLPTEGH